MTTAPNLRRHLVERAVEAFGQAPLVSSQLNAAQRSAHSVPEVTDAASSVTGSSKAITTAILEAEPRTASAPTILPRPEPISQDALRQAGLISGSALRRRATEELEYIQHQIVRQIGSTEPTEERITKMILVTSAKPGEGKTFCAVNIAARLALSANEPVILIDADGKKRDSLTDHLGQMRARGIQALATDPMLRPEMLIVPTALHRLSFLPYGSSPITPTERPSGALLAGGLTRLEAAMPGRILVVDAPPCLATSEPMALASIAGQVVMVVQAESTQRSELEAALDMVESCPALQLLLNRTKLVVPNAFGAYDYDGS